MPASYNPFSEGVRDQYFVGREKQQQQFVQHLEGLRAKVPNHIYVAGRDGTGKTSFLNRLRDLADRGGFVAADSSLDEKRTPAQQVGGIMRNMVSRLDRYLTGSDAGPALLCDWDKGTSSSIFSFQRFTGDAPASDLMREDFERLQGLMASHDVPGMVVCIDEGQRIHPSALSSLKNSLQECTGFLVVLSVRILPSAVPPAIEGRNMLDEKARQAEGDFGASAFYVAGIEMGPFESNDEAGDCVRRRLEGNIIQFDDEVIHDIAAIERRLPRGIVRLSSSVYSEVAAEVPAGGTGRAEARHLRTVFENTYPEVLPEMTSLLLGRPTYVRTYLHAVAQTPTGCTARGLAESLYPDQADELLRHLAEVAGDELDRLREVLPSLRKHDALYFLDDPVRAYALRAMAGEQRP